MPYPQFDRSRLTIQPLSQRQHDLDPETHGVWQPAREFKDELLWKGVLTTSPLTFEIIDRYNA